MVYIYIFHSESMGNLHEVRFAFFFVTQTAAHASNRDRTHSHRFAVAVGVAAIVCVVRVRVFQGLYAMFMALKETGHLNTPFR
jgi:hypothetical protein